MGQAQPAEAGTPHAKQGLVLLNQGLQPLHIPVLEDVPVLEGSLLQLEGAPISAGKAHAGTVEAAAVTAAVTAGAEAATAAVAAPVAAGEALLAAEVTLPAAAPEVAAPTAAKAVAAAPVAGPAAAVAAPAAADADPLAVAAAGSIPACAAPVPVARQNLSLQAWNLGEVCLRFEQELGLTDPLILLPACALQCSKGEGCVESAVVPMLQPWACTAQPSKLAAMKNRYSRHQPSLSLTRKPSSRLPKLLTDVEAAEGGRSSSMLACGRTVRRWGLRKLPSARSTLLLLEKLLLLLLAHDSGISWLRASSGLVVCVFLPVCASCAWPPHSLAAPKGMSS